MQYESENVVRLFAASGAGEQSDKLSEMIAKLSEMTGIAAEELARSVIVLCDAFSEACGIVKRNVKELLEAFNESYEKAMEREYHREIHKLDFTRKKIVHQVMCRKPKFLVKKIIR